ncbi:MAG: hypothetical protein LRZ98_02370 [Candidatus Pacebacteria bacterium]|nr:hypothetical protein [Candidatus Paceibacterota bacterium]
MNFINLFSKKFILIFFLICLIKFIFISEKSNSIFFKFFNKAIPIHPEPEKISKIFKFFGAEFCGAKFRSFFLISLIKTSIQNSVSERGIKGLKDKSILQFKKGIFPIKYARGKLDFNFFKSLKYSSFSMPKYFSFNNHFFSK